MIRLVRKLELAKYGALRTHVAQRQPGFRAYVMELRGMRYDAAMLGRRHVWRARAFSGLCFAAT